MIHTIKVWATRIIWLFIVLILLLFLSLFSQQNTTAVSIDLFDWRSAEIMLSNWLVIAFCVGALVGLASAVLIITKLKLANASLLRKLSRRDAEVKQLRMSTLKGLSNR